MAQQAEIATGPIRLAHIASFRLGAVEVHPSTRQVIQGSKSETLEPRVMQVLVALAQAHGAILTRDELIKRCWDGRIVSENAINRVISRVRQIAAELGRDSFQLETITKVGYRMVVEGGEHDGAAALSSEPGRQRPATIDRRFVIGGGVALAVGATGAFLWIGPKPNGTHENARALVSRGRELLGYGIPDRNAQALAYFREATQIDPAYAAAWGALALSETDPARKRSAAMRAIELDPANADAQAALILSRPVFGDWGGREAAYRRHLDRFPDQKQVQWALANLLCGVGRWRDAIVVLEALAALDPFLPLVRYRLINALWSAGRLQETDNALEDAFRRWPQHSAIWQTRFRILTYTGRASAALAFANDRSARPLDHDDEAGFQPSVAVARALASGERADFDAAVALNLDDAARHPEKGAGAAMNCAGLGRIEEAFALFEGYYFGRGPWAATRPRDPDGWLTLFLFYPSAASLRRDPRFAALVAQVGMEAYWHAAGVQPDYRRG